jgi:hypothetical protein
MSHNSMNVRSLVITAILLLGIIACTGPAAAADNAWFEINSEPTGAWACLDHWNCHDTPVTFSTEADSYHTVSVSKDGYVMSTQMIYASGPGVTTRLTIALIPTSPHTGVLNLDSTPSGAGIWIDMNYYGKTPQIIGGFTAGTHSLMLRKAGYSDLKQNVEVVYGQTTTYAPNLAAYPQQPGYGSLQVDSAPAGAAIFLNNNYQGNTVALGEPFDINQLMPGAYTVKLTLPDYETYTQVVTVEDGMIYDIHAILVPVSPGPTPDTTGEITVRSSPSGANIYLDNAYRGLTPLTLADIKEGNHAVILKLNGYQNWQSTVSVNGGTLTEVSGTLAVSSQPAAASTQLAPVQQPQSPVGMLTIITAIGICCLAAIFVVYRKNR